MGIITPSIFLNISVVVILISFWISSSFSDGFGRGMISAIFFVVFFSFKSGFLIGSIVYFEKADWNDKKKRIIVVNNFKYILLNQTTYVINNYV